MTRLTVWAPKAEKVEVVLDGRSLAMKREQGGWYAVDAPELKDGARYAFAVDGQNPVPDPRSRFQPEGVHAPSAVVDLSAFRWTDRAFVPRPLASGVVYELHVGTFSEEGTFQGAVDKLDLLVDLGVTHVEILPVAEFSGSRGWGYDGVSLYAPHHAYGGPHGLQRFVDACHARGLAVILDVVYNHLGPSGNYLSRFGPYFTDRHHTPWGDAVNFDGEDSDEVRRFFVDNALMWLRDYHIDGLRLDAVHAIVDTSAVHFLEELSVEVDDLSRLLQKPLVLIAESDLNDPKLVRPREAYGWGMDAAWSDDLHHALHAWLTGERTGYYEDFGGAEVVARALTRGYVYEGGYASSRRRRHGRPLGALSARKLLGYLQTHDQVGNRARGDRIAHLCSPARQMVGAALYLTSPFLPMIFMGEEWAASAPFQYFTDHQEPDLAESVRQGRRREFAAFGWKPEDVPDPQDRATFQRSRLDWGERERAPHKDVLAFYKALLALRRESPSLAGDRLEDVAARADDARGTLVVERGDLVIAANLGEAQVVPLPGGGARVLLSSSGEAKLEQGGVRLPKDSVAIVQRAGTR